MSEQHWRMVGEWFHRLADLEVAARQEALERLRHEVPEIEQEVLELLGADEEGAPNDPLEAGNLQRGALWNAFADALEDGRRRPRNPDLEPLVAGPFLVGRELGRGGMAVVHLGERADEDFRQIVAIKRLTGVDRKGLTERLLAERRILAELRHPNVAQLIDGGTDSAGRPYLALEYVDGQPIDEYCSERRASVRERLELFVQACAAVHYAHSKLVVHRDLKPSNILVDKRGHVKLLDFGIAKILDPALDAQLTLHQMRPLTPRYAAPEQFLGAPSTTATDVYGLGIVLYELVVGDLPYEVSGSDIDSYRKAVLEQRPCSPLETLDTLFSLRGSKTTDLAEVAASRSCSVRHLRRELKGDLRAVFEKVLHKEPEERYSSAEAFALDIRRYLEGKPVEARSPTASYLLLRFVSSHRWSVAAVTLIVASLSVGLGVATAQANRARRQEELTERQRARTDRVKDLLASIIVGADPDRVRQEKLTSAEFLERGIQSVLPRLEEAPEDLAALVSEMAIIYRRLGDLERARAYALEVVRVTRGFGGRTGELAQALYSLALVNMDLSAEDLAESLLKDILVLEDGRFADPSGLRAIPDQRPYAWSSLGSVNLRRRDLDAAEAFYRQAIGGFERDRVVDDQRVAVARMNLGFILVERGDLEGARKSYREVVDSLRRAEGPSRSRVSTALSNLGRIEMELDDLDAAEKLFREALAIDVAVYGPDHPSQSVDLAWLGTLEKRRDNVEKAVEWFERSVRSLASRPSDHPRVLAAKASLADALVSLAEAEGPGSRAKAMQANQLVEEVLEPIRQRFGEGSRRTLWVLQTGLRAQYALGDRQSAVNRLAELVPRIEAELGEDHKLSAESASLLSVWREAETKRSR